MQSDPEKERSADNDGELTSLSGDEFRQLQKQLLDLKNTNYELMEQNKQLQMQQQKSNDSFRFAAKFIGRKSDKQNVIGKWEDEINSLRTKLTTQEEEFRLQQSTLLAELNKVIGQNKVLAEQMKRNGDEYDVGSDIKESAVASTSEHTKTEQELEKEIAWLKGVLAEKDSLVEDIEILNKDVLRAKDAESERANRLENRCSLLEKQLAEKGRLYEELDETMKIKEEENALLKTRYEQFYNDKRKGLVDVGCQYTVQRKSLDVGTCYDEDIRSNYLIAVAVQTNSEFIDEYLCLQNNVNVLNLKCEEVLEAKRNLELRLSDLTASSERYLKELEVMKNTVEEQRRKIAEQQSLLEQFEESKEILKKQCVELELKEKTYKEKLEAKEAHSKEIESKLEEEMSSIRKRNEELEAQLELECKQCKERLKAKDQEMQVALKKQSSMVRELRRQVQQEKKRADQAEKQLEEVLGSGRHYRISGSPLVASDHSRNEIRSGVEGSSSVCSWAFGTENDRRSTHTFDGDESSCSASVLESDNVELIGRLAQLQKKHSETIDKLNVLEEENAILRKEVAEKSEVIAEWIRTRPCGDSIASSSSSPSTRIRRVFDMVRIDDSAADIRDMNRRLQRMLEETLSKNLNLQKDIQRLLESDKKDGVK